MAVRRTPQKRSRSKGKYAKSYKPKAAKKRLGKKMASSKFGRWSNKRARKHRPGPLVRKMGKARRAYGKRRR